MRPKGPQDEEVWWTASRDLARGKDRGRLPGDFHSPCFWTSMFLTAMGRGLCQLNSQGFEK